VGARLQNEQQYRRDKSVSMSTTYDIFDALPQWSVCRTSKVKKTCSMGCLLLHRTQCSRSFIAACFSRSLLSSSAFSCARNSKNSLCYKAMVSKR
jgi:hypothetical protein